MTEQVSHRRIARASPDAGEFIRANLAVAAIPLVPELRLYAAHPASGLRRFAQAQGGSGDAPPYWAYPWAGGMALARYLLDHPETVRGRTVFDLGAGSGLVGIAAMRAGARHATAAETDPSALAAISLNIELNGVSLAMRGDDMLTGPAPDADLVLAGDVFYDAALAVRVTPFLRRCAQAGIGVLIGDPGRRHLPRDGLRTLAQYPVPEFGLAQSGMSTTGYVFAFAPAA